MADWELTHEEMAKVLQSRGPSARMRAYGDMEAVAHAAARKALWWMYRLVADDHPFDLLLKQSEEALGPAMLGNIGAQMIQAEMTGYSVARQTLEQGLQGVDPWPEGM